MLAKALFLLRPLAFSKVELGPDGLTIDRIGKLHSLPFNEIISVKFSFLPYLGGWYKLKLSSGKAYRFTVVLERSEYILDAIASARPELIDLAKMEVYRRTAIVSDHSWGRFYSRLKSLQSLLLRFVAVPLALTTLASGLHLRHWVAIFIAVNILNLLVGTAIFIFCELLFTSQGRLALIADPNAVRRNLAYENKIAKSAGAVQIGTLSILVVSFIVWKLPASS